MKTSELKEFRDSAHEFLLGKIRPLPTPVIARFLFGARRHEMPETQVVVKTLLKSDPRFVETHDQCWTVLGSNVLRQPLGQTTFCVVDLETTGSVIGVDEIIEIGVVLVQGGQVVGEFDSLVWTDRTIPPWVARLTGISNQDLVGAPTFSDIAMEVYDCIRGNVFVAHDIRFDLPFLRWEFGRRGMVRPAVPGLCTLQLSRQIWPDLVSRSLPDLARHFEVEHGNPHRAAADAGATAGVLLEALQTAGDLGLNDLGQLYRVEEYLAEASDSSSARAAES